MHCFYWNQRQNLRGAKLVLSTEISVEVREFPDIEYWIHDDPCSQLLSQVGYPMMRMDQGHVQVMRTHLAH